MSTNQEPISGKLGNTAAGEPYDAGNMSGVPPHQSNVSQSVSYDRDNTLSSGSNARDDINPSSTHDRPNDGSTLTSTGHPEASRNAVSSAGRNDHEAAFASAGGVQGAKSGSDSAAAAATRGVGTSDGAGGVPAQEMTFTRKEIDEAANVNSSHENPHTIGPDGKEETLEEIGIREQKEADATAAGGHDRRHEKSGMGAKIEHMKEKVLHKH